MKNTLKLIIFLIISLLIANSSFATIYYVSPNGTDGLAGTSWTNAWRSINHAATNANVAGDIVIVSNGTYNEQVVMMHSGTAGNPIIFRALEKGQAVVNAVGFSYGFHLDNKNYIRIDGFEIKNATSHGLYLQNTSTYNQIINNSIYLNGLQGIYISSSTASNNMICSNHIFGPGQNDGVTFNYADNNVVSHNYIANNNRYGIYLFNHATGNSISRNRICSNATAGIFFGSNDTENNYIVSNQIWGPNQSTGIFFQNPDNNYIASNCIHDHSTGIYFNLGCASNMIYRNRVYNNSNYHIWITGSANADGNKIIQNVLWGDGSYFTDGIVINGSDYNIIRENTISHIKKGVWLRVSAQYNNIIKNSIYSNNVSTTAHGVYIQNDNNYIISNTIRSNYRGIFITSGSGPDNIKIFRNLIANNYNYGIYVNAKSTNIHIINNTIVKNFTQDGVYFNNNTSGTLYNNIICSNGDGVDDYGIEVQSTASVAVGYNDFYGNSGGTTNGGGFIWGAGNITNNPLIDTVNTFEITSVSSPCVDSGTNIPGVSGNFIGPNPDMGWKEFGTENTPPITTADKKEGFYSTEFDVTLTSVDTESPYNIVIYYTTDGSDPKFSSTVQNGSSPVTIRINKTTTLKFYARNSRGYEEEVQTIEYSFTKIPMEDVAVYNNYLDLSKGEPARIIFGKACTVEIKIYNMKGVLVKSYVKQYYKRGEGKEWYGTVKKTAKKVGAGLYIVVVKGDINIKLKMIVKK